MHVGHFLEQSALVLGAAVVVLVISGRLRLPSVVGLLVTGMAIGPSALGWMGQEEVEVLAEIGVVLLLFTIGLEQSLGKLRELLRPFLLGGAIQTVGTILAVTGLSRLLGLPLPEAIFLGFLASLSSTAIVLRLYDERRETGTPHGRLVLAILLFQDFMVVPMLALTPLLAGAGEVSAADFAVRFGGASAAVAAIFAAALFLVPRLLRLAAGARVREVFVLAALGLCLGFSWVTHHLGLSPALGAFLAGILLSESDYSHQIVADVVPFRDVLASVFFVSVGMLVNLQVVATRPLEVLSWAGAGVGLKAVLIAVAVLALGYPARVVALVTLGLAQIGEFAFVLLDLGRRSGLVDGQRFQVLLAGIALTMLVAPLLIRLAPWVAARWPAMGSGDAEAGEGLSSHVVIAGLGTNGTLLVRVLKDAGIPHLLVEIDPQRARRARREGLPVVFGDISRREILESAHIHSACTLVLAISDSAAAERAIRVARELRPQLHVVVRTRSMRDIEALREAGADEVVAEEFESAIEVFTHVLEAFHVPRNVIRAQTRVLRGEGYEMLRTERVGKGVSEAVLAALDQGTTDIFGVAPGSPAEGASLRELDLRRRTGATVLSVVRGETPMSNPTPDLCLEAGDALVLVGAHAQVEAAFAVLAGRPVEGV